ncbi:MAG: VCBS repeat-containing protein [Patescibacteria group bacterium]|nr:VCBS repeat-containing protein [Patescibacteria group bacterium]
MKKIFRSIICSLAIFGLLFSYSSLGFVLEAKATTASISVSPADTSLDVSTSYNYSFNISSELSSPNPSTPIVMRIQHWYGGPPSDGAEIDFTNTSVSWFKDDGTAISGVSGQIDPTSGEFRVDIPGDNTLAAGSTLSIKLNDVGNASVAGNYSVRVNTASGGMQTENAFSLGIDKYIEGYVTYDSGGRVSTCSVNANLESGQAWANANCDSNGYYKLALTQTGNWRLHLDAKHEDGQRVTTDWIYNSMDPTVSVSGAGTITKNFTVEKATSTVTGKIVNLDGSTLSDPMQFHLDLRNEQGRGSGTGLSENGSFSIPIKAGTYKLSLHSQDPKYYVEAKKVQVDENETKKLGNINLKEKTAQIKGRVVNSSGSPISNLRMNMWGQQGWGEAITDADGYYTMWGYPGEWEVRPDDWDASNKGLLLSGPPSRVTISSTNQTITGINFTLLASDASVTLNLVDSSGSAVENVFGWAFCRKAGQMPGPGNEFGTGIQGSSAQIPLIGGNSYICGVHMPPEVNMSVDDEVEVTLSSGQNKTANITLLNNDAVITGFLRDASTGEVITGVEGEVFAHGESMGMGYHSRINSDGSYRLSVRHGTYFIGYKLHSSGFMQGDSDHSPVTVSANGQTVKTIRVHRANAQIKAKVYDPKGNPVPWAWVWCDNMKQKEQEVEGPFEGGDVLHTGGETNGSGVANLGVVAGSYSCSAGLPPEMSSYMPPDMVDVTATANTDTNITLRFKESEGNVTGSVTMTDGSSVNMGFCHAWNPDGGFSGSPVMGGQFNIPLTKGTWYVGCDSKDGKKFYRSEETSITLSTVGDTLNKNFVLRKASFELPDAISKTFDAAQMTVIDLPDQSTISIPANAIANSGNYTLTATPNTDLYHTPEAKPALGFAWSLELTDSSGQSVTSSFNSDITLTVKYDDEYLVSEGIDETKIIGRYWDESSSTWKLPENVIQDSVNNTISIYVNHFTDFAVTTGSSQTGSRAAKNIVTGAKTGAGPHVTMWDAQGNNQANFMAYATNFRGGVRAVSDDLDGDGIKEIVTVPYSAGGPHVRVFNSDGENLANVFPYTTAFRGGLSLATGDVDGDGGAEIIVAPSSNGGPHVRVYKYAEGELSHYASWFAYPEDLRTGMEVYAGDVDGDGQDEVVTATKSGATPHVRVFEGDSTFINHFFAFPTAFRGGVNVTLGDYDGDGSKDIVTSPASSGGPQYRVFNSEGGLLTSGFAYNENWRLGMKTEVGDVDGDGEIEIITAPSNGGPHVKVFNSDGLESQFMAYNSTFRGGLELAVSDIDADGTADIVTVPMGQGGPHVKVQNSTGGLVDHFMSHHQAFRGGVNLTISQ